MSGLATAANRTEFAGFWGRLSPDVSSTEEPTASTLETRFLGAWPNPAVSSTTLRFDLAAPANASGLVPVRLELFDVSGRCVRVLVDQEFGPGAHQAEWDRQSQLGSKVGSGVYFARLHAGSYHKTARIVVR